MEKGATSEVNGIEYKVLDSRIKGAGQEIDIEMSDKGNRGIAVLKLYGPSSKKKESVVMVNKSKGSDSKYVLTLAQKIVKPLISKFLGGKECTEENLKEQNTKCDAVGGKEVKPLKCPHCEKTFLTNHGLKIHITKMHAGLKQNTQIVGKQKDEINAEANKVVDLLLREIIEIRPR